MVLKGPRFRVSPVRTFVVVGSLVVAVSLVVGASSPSSGLVGTNGTLVDTPAWIPVLLTLYHLHQCSFVCAKFLLQLSVGDDVFVLLLSFQGLVLLIPVYPTRQDQRHFTFVEDSGDFFQASYMACLRGHPHCHLLDLFHGHVLNP